MSAPGEYSPGLEERLLYLVRLIRSIDRDGATADLSIAAMGGTYEFTRFASANLREKDDSLNTAIGGFLAGSLMGLRCKEILGGLSLGH